MSGPVTVEDFNSPEAGPADTVGELTAAGPTSTASPAGRQAGGTVRLKEVPGAGPRLLLHERRGRGLFQGISERRAPDARMPDALGATTTTARSAATVRLSGAACATPTEFPDSRVMAADPADARRATREEVLGDVLAGRHLQPGVAPFPQGVDARAELLGRLDDRPGPDGPGLYGPTHSAIGGPAPVGPRRLSPDCPVR
ncbi:hypothetical protein ACWGA0_12220 [Streptomyces erythrochromogenes]